MAKRKRKTISTRTRFEVFKRDRFTCQYCGKSAPNVVLELEHIQPHSKGGTDDVLNLITSCWECNSGKGDRLLSDDAVVKKQRDQLAELQERRDQLEMMMQWRTGLQDLKAAEVDAAVKAHHSRVPGFSVNETGRIELRKLIVQNGLARVLEAIDRSADTYLVLVDGKATADSADHVWRMMRIFAQPDDVQILYRCRGIVKRRCAYCDQARAFQILKAVLAAGATHDQLLAVATSPEARNWTAWVGLMADLMESVGGDVGLV